MVLLRKFYVSPANPLVVELHLLEAQAGWLPSEQQLKPGELYIRLFNESEKGNLPEASYNRDSQVLAPVSLHACIHAYMHPYGCCASPLTSW